MMGVKEYRRKSTGKKILAVQYTGKNDHTLSLLGARLHKSPNGRLLIRSSLSDRYVPLIVDHWVVRTAKGEVYPVTPGYFGQIFAPVKKTKRPVEYPPLPKADPRNLTPKQFTGFGDTQAEVERDAFHQAREFFGPAELQVYMAYDLRDNVTRDRAGKYMASIHINATESQPVNPPKDPANIDYYSTTARSSDGSDLEEQAFEAARKVFGEGVALKVGEPYKVFGAKEGDGTPYFYAHIKIVTA